MAHYIAESVRHREATHGKVLRINIGDVWLNFAEPVTDNTSLLLSVLHSLCQHVSAYAVGHFGVIRLHETCRKIRF